MIPTTQLIQTTLKLCQCHIVGDTQRASLLLIRCNTKLLVLSILVMRLKQQRARLRQSRHVPNNNSN
ncbi:hypothetical protein O3P69_020735 [Scylla paramamosain]|uniref:Uncharacterized protein n=1 Tax=Scylla paramamosain TaxID=85552 RepID=A0AAW0TQQ2_SCYPA